MLLPFLRKEIWGGPNGKTPVTLFLRAKGNETSTTSRWHFTTVKVSDEPHYDIFAKTGGSAWQRDNTAPNFHPRAYSVDATSSVEGDIRRSREFRLNANAHVWKKVA